jgi:aromatic-L-amino-acid/L-tryptophan decarboxylase
MGMFAEMLAAATDANSGNASYHSNNYVEMQVLDWCKAMLGYPLTASGLLTSGCSASNLIGITLQYNSRQLNTGKSLCSDLILCGGRGPQHEFASES